MNNKVSIVIPLYNKEKYIKRCLESVIKQTYSNIEVIIVDDGSTDGSKRCIDKYLEKHDFKYYYKENGGISSARNYGLQYVTGDYVYFLDPDDEIVENAIDVLVKVTGGNDIVIGNFRYITEKGDILDREIIESLFLDCDNMNTNDVYDYFYGRCYGISACNKLYRMVFLKKSGVEFQANNEIYAEDLLFNLMLFTKKPRIAVTERQTYNYYQNDGSITKSCKPKFAERFANLINVYYSLEGKRDDVACFTICNAINSISRQEKTFKDILSAVNTLLLTIDCRDIINVKYANNIQSKRKIDVCIVTAFANHSIFLLCLYLKLKNILIRN